MTKNLEALKGAYKHECDLLIISQGIEGRSEEVKRSRLNYYRARKEGVCDAALWLLSKKEYKKFKDFALEQKGFQSEEL